MIRPRPQLSMQQRQHESCEQKIALHHGASRAQAAGSHIARGTLRAIGGVLIAALLSIATSAMAQTAPTAPSAIAQQIAAQAPPSTATTPATATKSLPAVTVAPSISGWSTGSDARRSSVELARGCSSAVKVDPSGRGTGTISSSKSPLSREEAARR